MDSGYYELTFDNHIQNVSEEKGTLSDDLTKLAHLTSHAALTCLSERYKLSAFYTWAGPTLVAINPLQDHPALYSEETAQEFSCKENYAETRPHIFALAEKARKKLLRRCGKINQAIVVSGESGAGKTCSAKYLLRYLANFENSSPAVSPSALEDKVLLSNPILEAFGNAQTLRNNNSSRFGKLLKLNFQHGLLSRAHIQTYLLERTRVSFQPVGERNFHIFYQLAAANPTPEFQLQKDGDVSSFSLLPGNCFPEDKVAFQDTALAMEKLGFSRDQRAELWSVLAGILHLGQLKFVPKGNECWSMLDNSNCTKAMSLACQLLGLDNDSLVDLLTTRTITAGQSCFKKPVGSEGECSARRDTLIRFIYQKVFQSIVDHINVQLNAQGCRGEFMGILDVYGFESFEFNSLEQLCINYANERLQQYFVRDFLLIHQKTLEDEGIVLDCSVNDEERLLCIKTLDGPFSVFGVLNEGCQLKRNLDEQEICHRLQAALTQNSSTTPRKRENLNFTVHHYAGNVKYSVRGLVEKNGDQVPEELLILLCESSNRLIRCFGQEDLHLHQSSQKSGRKHTVLAKFKASMDTLLRTLGECDVHYVRCIKPCENICPYISNLQPYKGRQSLPWEDDYVEGQLRACGVMETVKLSRMGFPIRLKLDEFYQRFRILSCKQNNTDARRLAEELVECLGPRRGRLGKLRIFLTEDGMEWLEKKRDELQTCAATVIQTAYRSHQARNKYNAIKRSVIVLQKAFRLVLLRQRVKYYAQVFQRQEKQKRELESKRKAVAVVTPTVRETFVVSQVPALGIPCDYTENAVEETSVERKGMSEKFDLKQWQDGSPIKFPFVRHRMPTYESSMNKDVLVLTLPRRFPVFWKDGILSVRKPPNVKVHILPKVTCLPFSHLPPRALLCQGLLDAL